MIQVSLLAFRFSSCVLNSRATRCRTSNFPWSPILSTWLLLSAQSNITTILCIWTKKFSWQGLSPGSGMSTTLRIKANSFKEKVQTKRNRATNSKRNKTANTPAIIQSWMTIIYPFKKSRAKNLTSSILKFSTEKPTNGSLTSARLRWPKLKIRIKFVKHSQWSAYKLPKNYLLDSKNNNKKLNLYWQLRFGGTFTR